jgi:glycosyltransferase involved in cell wall biosynthesis/predicted Zn-dependent protease
MNPIANPQFPEPAHPPLPRSPADAPRRRLKICIASFDFVGPVRNGGVGTAFTSLGEALARGGHDVTFLYLSGNFCENRNLRHWIDEYQKKNIRFVPMPALSKLKLGASFHMARSYEAFLWLDQEAFDVIHFSEWRAPGYYALAAKAQGLAFSNTTLCIHTHGPTLWSLLSNGEYLTQISDVELDFMERQSVKLADVVVCPSHYLARWMRDQKWELPERTFVQQYVQPANARRKTFSTPPPVQAVRELVFFGRIEVRKGLVLFCDALDRLIRQAETHALKITFLGKLTKINDQEGLQYLKDRARKWPWKWEVIDNLDQTGALTYLQSEGRLALIPSLVDNLPNTVLECLGGGVPFLASDIGGIPEMIFPEDRANILFPLRPAVFADKILQAVSQGVRPARFACEPAATEQGWLDWHNGLDADGFGFSVSTDLLNLPLVSVCMSHFNRPRYLGQALDSLRAQTYQNFEVVLVDDASSQPEAIAFINSLEAEFAQRGWQLIRNREELFVGAARNVAARHARGEYLLFMDDDNLAKPNELAMFVSVARKTGADTVSCCLDFFSTEEPPASNQVPDQRFLFLGPAAAASALRNYLGDTNSLFRREVFLKLGGFHEERGVGHEDWELLGKGVLSGYHHEAIPEALVWYRRLKDGGSATTNNSLQRGHMRNIQPYLDAVPPALRTLVLFAQGQVIDAQSNQNGAGTAQIAYLQQSLRWRGLFEAARELRAGKQEAAAAKLLKSALTAATATKSPVIMLEALLAVGTEMHAANDPDTTEVLRLAQNLARNFKRTADADYAAALLASSASHQSKTIPAAAATKNHGQTKPGPQTPEVSIIIPVFNNLLLTQRCLHLLAVIGTSAPHEIIVVDNASTDGTGEFLKSASAPGNLRTITNAENEGFARGCNRGAQAALGKILLFLNNDTQVTAGWLEALVKAVKQPGVGVAGAKLLYADGTIQHAGIEFIKGLPDHPHRRAPGNTPAANQFRELDMTTGACFMVHRDLFQQLAGFDESYRNGVEDVDLCLRVRAAGFKVVYEPKSVVYHLEGQSEGRFNHVSENLKLFFSRWDRAFDKNWRFIVPTKPKFIAASKSLLPLPNPVIAPVTNDAKNVSVSWEGSFLDHGSLSHVNRELVGALKLLPGPDIKCVANGGPVAADAAAVWPSLAREILSQPAADAAITVRHAWPPNWKRPAQGRLVVIQPWEFGFLPETWVAQARDVDEFWLPSEYVRRVYLDSGVPANKVFVVPNGVDAGKFHPQAAPLKLATGKKFKFLFVGGTIGRKGPDRLLQAYLKNFSATDDVCLVIKDFGGKSVYVGQTFEQGIRTAQARPNAPEILYLNEELPPESLPSLYTACDCLVLPYRGEGFGLPVLEAMACGLPVIVTAGGATDDFVRDDFAYRIPAVKKAFGREAGGMKLVADGWLLEPDLAALGDFMRRVFQNPAEGRQRGQLAREQAQQWSWNAAAAIAARRLEELAAVVPAKAQPAAEPQPFNPPAVAEIGQLTGARQLFGQKDLPGAWQAAAEAVKLRPFHPEAFLLLAEIALAAGAGKIARRLAQRAREMAPSWPPARQFLARPIKGDAKQDWLQPAALFHPPSAPSLSVCMIVKNEERFLAQCLKSIRGLATQIVVVDTGSTDRTVEIAREFGAEIYSFAWCDDFAAARNAAQEHATGDWILLLDADEELPAAQHPKLIADMKSATTIAFRLPRVDAGREIEGRGFTPRLFRNAPEAFFRNRIHEQIFPSLLVSARKWGLKIGLGSAEIVHHGSAAEVLRDRNKVERNLKLLRVAVEEHPADVNLLMNLGLELVRSDELAAGIEKYREVYDRISAQPVAEVAPELREALLTQFTFAKMRATHPTEKPELRVTSESPAIGQPGKARAYEDVVQILTSPLAQHGGLTASLHFALGLAYFELKQFSKAADQMRQCLAKRREPCLTTINTDILTAAPRHCLALCLAALADLPGAEKAFVAAVAETARADEARMDFAIFLQSQNRTADALAQLRGLVTANPRQVTAWQLGAEIALGRAEFLEFARDWTAEAVQALPENPILAAQRAEALSKNAAPTPPLEIITGGEDKPLPSQSAGPRARPAAARLGQLDEARELFGRKNLDAAWSAALTAVAQRPFHPEAFLLLAEIALAAGAGRLAKECAQRARDFAPGWKPARQFLGQPLKGDAKPDWLQSSSILPPPSLPRLSVCLIVKNEERFLAQCLKSVRGLAAQTIVVDTGSTDRTVEIAREFGAEIHSFAWGDDFGAARNAALEHATGDWILMLDADEELPEPQHAQLIADMKCATTIAFRLPLINAGQENAGHSYIPRLFRNAPEVFYCGRIHEQVFPSLLVPAKKWGLKTALGTAEILHHGYTKEMVQDRNKIERNLKLLQAAVVEDPEDVNLVMNLGMELVRSDQLQEGIVKYRQAFRMMSGQRPEALVPELREVLLTQFTSQLYKVRAHEEILEILSSPLAKHSELTPSLHFALGLAHFELKQFREAADQMRQCLGQRQQRSLTPINTDIHTAAPHHCLALCLAELGEVAAAEQAFTAALAATGHVEAARLDCAKFLRAQKRHVEALQQLHALVTANSRNVAAWQLGSELALGRPELLKFALDWTAEASKTLPENPLLAAQRAEALMVNNQAQAAAPIWEQLWRSEPEPRTLAALLLCETASGQLAHAPSDSRAEKATSVEFILWYQKLIATRAKPLIVRINGQLEPLARVLPTAAEMLQNALSESDAPVEV